MNPISMRSFPKQPLAKRSLGKPWAQAGWQAFGAASRHLRWAEGIASKLAHRSRRMGLHPEAMNVTHPFRPRILRLQNMLRHTHSETRLVYSPAHEERAVGRVGPQSHFKAGRQFAVPPQTIVERIRSLVSFSHEIQRWSTLTILRRNHTLEFVERIATPRASTFALDKTGPLAILAPSSARRGSTHVERQFDDDNFSAATLSDRLLRKHRRVEVQPFFSSRAMGSQSVPAHRQAQQRPIAETESTSRQNSVPQAPNINVAQITDAVLQQLDRRLVGARERMGRM